MFKSKHYSSRFILWINPIFRIYFLFLIERLNFKASICQTIFFLIVIIWPSVLKSIQRVVFSSCLFNFQILNQFKAMTLRTLDQRLDTAEEGLREVGSSMVGMKKQVPVTVSWENNGENRNRVEMACEFVRVFCSNVLKKTNQGNSYTPPSLPLPCPLRPPPPPPPLTLEANNGRKLNSNSNQKESNKKLDTPILDGMNPDRGIPAPENSSKAGAMAISQRRLVVTTTPLNDELGRRVLRGFAKLGVRKLLGLE